MTVVRSDSRALPPEWSWRILRDITVQIQDGTHFSPRPGGVDYKYVTSRNIGPGYLKLDSVETISAEEHRKIFRRCNVRFGDLLLTKDGANTGNAAISTFREEVSLLSSVAAIRADRREALEEYLLQYLLSGPGRKQITDAMSGNAITRLTLSTINQLVVPLPPVEEQLAIAAALATCDDQIKSLEKFIAKLESVRAAMLQQLLTGKMRLPGLNEPWRTVPLGSSVRYVKVVALSRAHLDGRSPLRYLHYGDIHTSDAVRLDAASAPMPRVDATLAKTAGRLEVGDLVLVDASEDPEGIGKAVEITSVPDEGVVPGLHTIAARFDKQVLADGFKAYLQFIPAFRAALLRLAAGTKVLATTRSHVSSITLLLPSADEQRAIAEALGDADAEIAAVRARLRKAQAVKQGMMQELLSGRTQLPVETEAVA